MMTLTEFLRNNPNIRCDCRVYLPDFDFKKLNEYIQKSGFLQSRVSLKWLCNNYNKILTGFYNTYGKYVEEDRPERHWLDNLDEYDYLLDKEAHEEFNFFDYIKQKAKELNCTEEEAKEIHFKELMEEVNKLYE